MKRNRLIIETFEAFNKDNLEYLVNHKKTYVRKNYRHLELNKLQKIVKNYDISKFKYDDRGYGIFIYPDKEFIELLKELDPMINDNIHYYISITGELNEINFTDGVPPYLQGLGVAYKLYKMTIDNVKFITSDRYSSLSAYNLWYSLLQDNELYCFTSNLRSGLISKKINNDELVNIIDKVKIGVNDIEYDDELIEKLNNIGYKL